MEGFRHISFEPRWTITPSIAYELGQCQAVVHAISDMPIMPERYAKLLHISLRKGALATTAIEGNTLTEEDLDRIESGESLPPSKEYQEIEVMNIIEALNTLLDEVAVHDRSSLVCPELLLRFHYMVGKDLGPHFDAIPGRFRTDTRVVGRYRAPRHEDVPALIDRLCEWLRREFHYQEGQTFAQAVIQAIVTHVYIEWIHPFGDGNGRTGRLVEFYLLLRAGTPDVASHILSNHYNDTRSEYYRQLDRAGKTGELTDFIAYAVQGFRDGLLQTLGEIQRGQFDVAWREYIYEKFAKKSYNKKSVMQRQRRLILNMPRHRELTPKEMSQVNLEVALDYAGLSDRTIQRDVEELVAMELVQPASGGRFKANVEALLNRVVAIRRPYPAKLALR